MPKLTHQADKATPSGSLRNHKTIHDLSNIRQVIQGALEDLDDLEAAREELQAKYPDSTIERTEVYAHLVGLAQGRLDTIDKKLAQLIEQLG